MISIIVPIYRIERYLGACIESLIRQTYKDIEIILVDDGSPDRSPEICDLYAAKDRRIKVIHKENGGLVSARKAGLQAAQGDLIGYVDGDDWVEPDFCEALHAAMAETKADVVCAGMSRDLFDTSMAFQNAVPVGFYLRDERKTLLRQMISFGDFYRPGVLTYVWNKLFRRDVLYEAQMAVDERISLGEDGAAAYPALLKCEKICVTDNHSYHYRQREDSMLKAVVPFAEEAKKLRFLHQCLLHMTADSDDTYGLERQIDEYVLSIAIIRSGGVTGGLPYGVDFRGKRVAVYSAGTFGQQIINRIRENQHCELVGWVDPDYWEYRRCCFDVDPVESVAGMDCDYVLLATVDGEIAQDIKSRLAALGVEPKRILTVSCPKEQRREMLRHYLSMGAA